jgi:hypothetical protein
MNRLLDRQTLREQLAVCENALKALRWHESNIERERLSALRLLAATRPHPQQRVCTF